MTELAIYRDADPSDSPIVTSNREEIALLLEAAGVRYELWNAEAELERDADDQQILAAYATEIARLSKEQGYNSVDVFRIAPDNPNRNTFRHKFLAEHTHDEDEVRFFVEGSAAFYLHIGDKVYRTVCTRGDLLSVPAGTPHWFDMGPEPRFTAIRLFVSPEGWVATFTGSAIAETLPLFEDQAASHAELSL
jgi:1,2-dihydroxy-3-keto-5-methylthiopentene dioxygenase